MTLFDPKGGNSLILNEKNGMELSYDFLKPPKITLNYVLNQFRFYYSIYRAEKLSISEITQFMIIRLIQRISYNFGWFQQSKR